MTSKQKVDHRSAVELTKTLRKLVQQVRISDAPPTLMQAANRALQSISEMLEPHQFLGTYAATQLDGSGDFNQQVNSPQEMMPYSPLIGDLNPVAPPFQLRYVGDRVEGEGVFPPTFTGPPNTAHGGMIAAVFDELLTAVVMANGPSAFTGTLTVRYLSHTVVGKEVRLKASCTSREGRKVFASGEMIQGETLTAIAEGIFIVPKTDLITLG